MTAPHIRVHYNYDAVAMKNVTLTYIGAEAVENGTS
jgi:hypothetical protein